MPLVNGEVYLEQPENTWCQNENRKLKGEAKKKKDQLMPPGMLAFKEMLQKMGEG